MLAVRILVGVAAVASVLAVLLSVLRTVVLPRAVPARLARLTFLTVRAVLLARLRITGRHTDYATRDRVFALQAPLGVFAQLFVWATLLFVSFSALFWASAGTGGRSISGALELAGSSMLTLGFDKPAGLARQFVAFAAAGVGLTLLALVITYLPSLYGAFSRREALIVKLVVRAGAPPTGARLLQRTWELERFAELEEVWNRWEDWFVELGESHTTFPQLGFFRSSSPRNHWVLAAEAVLDGAVLLGAACDVERQSRSELCVEAGVQAITAIADFLGVPREPPADEPEIALPRETFDTECRRLAELGVPMLDDRDLAWDAFRRGRARYEPLLASLGRMTDAPRSDWSSWSDETPRHSPPLVRIHLDSAP